MLIGKAFILAAAGAGRGSLAGNRNSSGYWKPPGAVACFLGNGPQAERREAMTAILPKPLNGSANGPDSAQHDPGLPLPCLLYANRGSQRIREGLVMY